ncbi:carbohydrate ABC transporter permease [Actinokineospora soli]|uniref:Carbohydrate ABC transporter permease n=1 Tax=Actinokineospora soli TaxID=1048753 RepID=A0ABW2TNQ0_9PSEU
MERRRRGDLGRPGELRRRVQRARDAGGHPARLRLHPVLQRAPHRHRAGAGRGGRGDAVEGDAGDPHHPVPAADPAAGRRRRRLEVDLQRAGAAQRRAGRRRAGGGRPALARRLRLGLPAVGFIGTWVSTGLAFLLLLSGIGRIDPSLYEAAKLDGCGPVREFRHITVPGLRREIAVAATVTMIAALAGFDIVYIMTGGGPGHATTVPGVQIYELVFTAGRVGAASALAVVLAVLTCAVMFVLNRASRERA